MHGLISRRKAYATGRINQLTTFLRTGCKQHRLQACIGLSELISQLTRGGCQQSAMRRLQSTLVCVSITCNPLISRDQSKQRMTSVGFSHELLWCRLEWKRVSQLHQTRTCSQAIEIQYHSDKDTTTLSFAESCDTFSCLWAL